MMAVSANVPCTKQQTDSHFWSTKSVNFLGILTRKRRKSVNVSGNLTRRRRKWANFSGISQKNGENYVNVSGILARKRRKSVNVSGIWTTKGPQYVNLSETVQLPSPRNGVWVPVALAQCLLYTLPFSQLVKGVCVSSRLNWPACYDSGNENNKASDWLDPLI